MSRNLTSSEKLELNEILSSVVASGGSGMRFALGRLERVVVEIADRHAGAAHAALAAGIEDIAADLGHPTGCDCGDELDRFTRALAGDPAPVTALWTGYHELPLRVVLDGWRDGDEHGWATEFAYLRSAHRARISELTNSIRRHGILEPVLLGGDGRVWDGHHRLCVAESLQLPIVPVDLEPAAAQP